MSVEGNTSLLNRTLTSPVSLALSSTRASDSSVRVVVTLSLVLFAVFQVGENQPEKKPLRLLDLVVESKPVATVEACEPSRWC